MRRRSTLPGRYQPSTIDVLRLNCCVRYGNRWDPQAIATAKGERIGLEACASGVGAIGFRACALFLRLPQVSASCASTRSACLPHADNRTVSSRFFVFVPALVLAQNQAFDRLVSSSSIRYRTSTDDLSPCRLQGVSRACAPGIFFLRWASRLDAFSVYPFRTSLPCYAVGTTTVAPEVRPFRSSRTRNSSSHDSYAHDG